MKQTNQSIYRMEHLPLEQDSLLLQETIFHNANGYIGVRSAFEEGYPSDLQSIRGTYINGFYDFAEMKQAEKLCGLIEEKQTILNVVDSQGIRLKIDDEIFSLFEGSVLRSERLLHMEDGYTLRHIVWRSPLGKDIEITIKRMTSFVQLSLFTIEYSVKALNFDGFVTFVSTHIGDVHNYFDPNDPRVAGESLEHLIPVHAELFEDASCLVTRTAKSDLAVCSVVKNVLSKKAATDLSEGGHRSICTLTTSIAKDETVTLTKYTIITDSLRSGNCVNLAFRRMSQALSSPLETLYREQHDYLQEYWSQALLTIDGDEELSLAIRYNLYQLLQSVGKDAFSNIAAKGLSGEGYEGHYFWDTEMYIQPFFTLTNPVVSKNLISYRYATLEQARENARILGHTKGALYPWRTIMGKECSGYFVSGSAAYHINGDIAYAIVAYYLATKDLRLIAEQGAEILFETARLWMDVGNDYHGQFVINEVTGPDEYTCMVNNNYFTNVSAKYNLYWAVKFYGLLEGHVGFRELCDRMGLTDEEIQSFSHAAETMYLPYDQELNINPQDDSFLQKKIWDLSKTPKDQFPLLLHYHPLYLYRHQVCKQADTVLAHFIYEDAQELTTIRSSYEYYEKVTTHDSSLSTCIFSIMAAKLGMIDKAYGYFGDSAKLDLFNTHHNTKDGIHTANMGGTYMAVVYGFGGLRLKEGGLYLSPSLPGQWNGYRFRINYEGSQIEVHITQKTCTLTLLHGMPVNIFVYGREYCLSNQCCIGMQMKYKAIIFDLDGVICHTDEYHYQAWKAIADELHIPFDKTINNRLRGVSRRESFEIILENHDGQLTEEEIQHYIAKKNDIYKQLLCNMAPADLPAEVSETLDRLRLHGLRLAIGSSSKNARLILDRIGLGSYFDAVSDGNNITCSKPDPEVFLKACEYVGVPASQCLVVEDAVAGVQAAINGGMDCAAISDAAKAGVATYQLEQFGDLLEIVNAFTVCK